ncbi:hypothetical protein [Pseudomonas sp. R16(2017)]|uniref:hypothetical protein n=1 Tax=Pseudomonas sp. R16(2017) TaxID=1981704 RepID=UPI000A1F9DC3|nr:hypothetical protein [Pseudomonas sp. R16(2017)]
MNDYENLQKRCQRGAMNLNDANNLLAECHGSLGAMAAEIKRLKDVAHGFCDDLHTSAVERDQLKAEVDSLTREADRQYTTIEAYRKDAERYRWLSDKFGITNLPCAVERILGGDVYVADGKASIDAAIDAAMKEVTPCSS